MRRGLLLQCGREGANHIHLLTHHQQLISSSRSWPEIMSRMKVTTTTIQVVYDDDKDNSDTGFKSHRRDGRELDDANKSTKEKSPAPQTRSSERSGTKRSSGSGKKDIVTPARKTTSDDRKAMSEGFKGGKRRQPLKPQNGHRRRHSLFPLKLDQNGSGEALTLWDKARTRQGYDEWLAKQQEMDEKIDQTPLSIVRETVSDRLNATGP